MACLYMSQISHFARPLLNTPARLANRIRNRRGTKYALALGVIVLAVVGIIGCGAVEKNGARGVKVVVSRDFGGRLMQKTSFGKVPKDQTVMDVLKHRFDVETRFGGQFIQAINGLSAASKIENPVDWFYYVNGVESHSAAASHKLYENDRVWWDHHQWSTAMRIPAVVGSFPQPFLSGMDGKRLPVRIECVSGASAVCHQVRQRLENVKVKMVATSQLGQPIGKDTLRIVVGPWSAIRRDPAARLLEQGPTVSGVFARFDPAGKRIDLLNPNGKVQQSVGGGVGIVAATRFQEQAPTWVVTGTDSAGVEAAAGALTENALANHFAVAVVTGRPVALPILFPQPQSDFL